MFLIFCQTCNGEQWAYRRCGPLPGGTRAWELATTAVWNVCRGCSSYYPGLLGNPGARRAERRRVAAGQMRLPFAAENR